jgi:hypothetical protein
MLFRTLALLGVQLAVFAAVGWEAYIGSDWSYTTAALNYTTGAFILIFLLEWARFENNLQIKQGFVCLSIVVLSAIFGAEFGYPRVAMVAWLGNMIFGPSLSIAVKQIADHCPIWVQRLYFNGVMKKKYLQSAKRHVPESSYTEFQTYINGEELNAILNKDGIQGVQQALMKWAERDSRKRAEKELHNLFTSVAGQLGAKVESLKPKQPSKFELEIDDFRKKSGLN